MGNNNKWLEESPRTLTKLKLFFGNLAVYVRNRQYRDFMKIIKPGKETTVLDVGVSGIERIKGTNLFEKLYPYPNNLTVTTIEQKDIIRKNYPKINVVKVKVGCKLPFATKKFDVSVSWATLEHIGGYKKQEEFLNELLRVGKKVYITTPYRGCIYEPHSELFFLHWLPLKLFRTICILIGKNFWSSEDHLNPLYVSDITKMNLIRKVELKVYKTFGFIPSHIIIS